MYQTTKKLAAAAGMSLILTCTCIGTVAFAATPKLVTDASIALQKKLTTVHKLKNGIPVIVRENPDSDIVQVDVTFDGGLKDLPPGQKALNQWLWSVLPLGAKGYPKAKVFNLSEKYGFELGCSGGIEMSSCGLGTLNEYWKEGLPLLAALIEQPTFADADVKLTKERLEAQLHAVPSDPGAYINEVINKVFYPAGHPYRLNHDEALKELSGLKRADLVAYHKQVLNATGMAIVVVSSMPPAKIVADLDQAFGAIPKIKREGVTVEAPHFVADHAYSFNDRTLPTAYISIKLNAPSITSKDAVATRLLYEVLSETLENEIRTKRSLSYAVSSFVIQYSVGIGVISVSTSHPKETLAVIGDVLQKVKKATYTNEELAAYKHVFATSYYLTQETNASLAAALAQAHHFYGDANEYYEMPRRLDAVTPVDIKRLADEQFANLRIGVIDGRKDFEDKWALDLIKKNIRPVISNKDETRKSH